MSETQLQQPQLALHFGPFGAGKLIFQNHGRRLGRSDKVREK